MKERECVAISEEVRHDVEGREAGETLAMIPMDEKQYQEP
jgi:hypothetical protein